MLRSKKESAWRTAMIMQELDAELEAHDRCAADIVRQRSLEEARDNLEDELRHYQARYKELAKSQSNGTHDRVATKRSMERVRAELRGIAEEHATLRDQVERTFHPYWGSLLKQDNELSSFGQQVDTYADVYMRRVSCLRHYSPMQFFRSPHDLMPHEV
jgi:hypothetical protein